VKTESSQAFGLNQFYIKVDAGANDSSANGDVEEISETNNVQTPNLLLTQMTLYQSGPMIIQL